MKRVDELVAKVVERYPNDGFFENFQESVRANVAKRSYYLTYERALRYLDAGSWLVLSGKALAHFRDHREGQLKQGFFNQLNEAFAYRHLVRCGFASVRVLLEDGKTTPDLTYHSRGNQRFCEVKTIGISLLEIGRRGSGQYHDRGTYRTLDAGFLKKLECDLKSAQRQLSSNRANGISYVVVNFDDFTLDHYAYHRRQLEEFLGRCCYGEVYLKLGVQGRRHVHKRPGRRVGA